MVARGCTENVNPNTRLHKSKGKKENEMVVIKTCMKYLTVQNRVDWNI